MRVANALHMQSVTAGGLVVKLGTADCRL